MIADDVDWSDGITTNLVTIGGGSGQASRGLRAVPNPHVLNILMDTMLCAVEQWELMLDRATDNSCP